MTYCQEISSSVVSLGDYLFSKASAVLHLRIWGIELFCREKLEDPSGEEVQEKSALCPCSKEGQPRAGQQECRQQVRASDYRHVFNTCKTTFHSSFLAFQFKKDIDILRSPSQWGDLSTWSTRRDCEGWIYSALRRTSHGDLAAAYNSLITGNRECGASSPRRCTVGALGTSWNTEKYY